MRMYPAVLRPSTGSSAERRVFELLAATDLGPHAFALHSLHLAKHDEKRMAEADFVVISTDGVLVVEVKGGGVSCRHGIWTYRDRFAREHRSSEGPFHQAKSAMWALHRVLSARDESVRNVRFGYAVVTPDTNLPASVEWPEATMIGHSRLAGRGDMRIPLERVWDHWRRVDRSSRHHNLDPPMSKWLRQQMQPDFDRVPLLAARSEDLDRRTAELTEQQLRVLDLFTDFPRVLVVGGAGSGKTFLAAEAARRAAAQGSTAFVVHSRQLAEWLRHRLPDEVSIMSAGHLNSTNGLFKTVVVDEAQDLMLFETLDVLERMVEGGLAGGRWRVFADVNNQVGVVGVFDPSAWDYLVSLAPPAARLTRNCRNTSNIVNEIRQTTGADLGVADAGEGPKVEWVRCSERLGVAEALARRLDHLAEEEVPPGQVAVLSFAERPKSLVDLMPESSRRSLSELSIEHLGRPAGRPTFSSIRDFKGLEAPFVHVIDVPERLDEELMALLYVAFSRARTALWVGCTSDAYSTVQEQIVKHMMGRDGR